jgi:hypothetical protein
MPTHPAGVETPRSANHINPTSPNAPASSFSKASERPFGAALGLDAPEHPHPQKPNQYEHRHIEEQLFTVKVGPDN